MDKKLLIGLGAVTVLAVLVAKATKNAGNELTKEAKERPITLEKKAEI
jgi:hypothetical protein